MERIKTFGRVNNRDVELFTLKNSFGMEVSLTNYGGIVSSILVPLADGNLHEVVLGFDTLEEYLLSHHYFGAIIGRYANRIANGRFSLDDKIYSLQQNSGSSHLHGGEQGFDKVVWDAIPVYADSRTGIQLCYLSGHGEEGYPGSLKVQVTYWLTESNELIINYLGETDAKTIVCLTHHGYFNLSKSSTIKEHTLQLAADKFTPVDSDLIPTGELRGVEDTICDLRAAKELGAILDSNDGLLLDGGFDHNFVLAGDFGSPCATLFAKDTGLKLEMYTSEPGVHVYTGNLLGSDADGVQKIYPQFGGLCLEAQHFPNSPNCPDFPNVVLQPGEIYRQSTKYSFSAY